jgi:hypothetical protein
MVIDLGFQSMNQLLDLLSQSRDAVATDHLGVENRRDALHCMLEVVVDNYVFVFLDRPQFLQGGI